MEPLKSGQQRGGSIVICLSADVKPNTNSLWVDAAMSERTAGEEQEVKTVENSWKEVDRDEVSKTSEDRTSASSTNAADELSCETKVDLPANAEAKDRDTCNHVSPVCDLRPVEPEKEVRINDDSTANDYDGAASGTTKVGGNFTTPVMQESSAHENGSEIAKDSVRHSAAEHVRQGDEVVDGIGENLADCQEREFESAEPKITTRASDGVRKKSEIELEYDLVDPLEVARQVAIEVEREVVDCREQSCSSSDGAPEAVGPRPDNPGNEPESGSCVQEYLPKEVPSEEELSVETSELREKQASNAEKHADEPVSVTQEIEYSQETNVNREISVDAEKSTCDFDLNKEVSLEEMDGPENQISTPTAVVSWSRAATVAGMPDTPFHFEGILGLKGAAATSASQATLPHKVPDVDKAYSAGGSNNGSKQRDGCLDIDLNIDDSSDEKPVDDNSKPFALPSVHCAVEASEKKLERLKLDLNCVTDDDDGTCDAPVEEQIIHMWNGYHNSSSSSSSSSKQPSFRNIDLNDQPSIGAELPLHPFMKLPQDCDASVAKTFDDSVISVMGMKVEVNKIKSMSNSSLFLNGRNPVPPQPALDDNLARAGVFSGIGSALPYAHPSVYGYTFFTPSTASVMFSDMYGPSGSFPYMLDSRGAPVIPQVISAAPVFQPAFSQPHYMPTMASMPVSPGIGPSEVNLDPNSGLILGGSRDNGGLTRQFFSTGQGRLMDDRLTSNSQPSNTLVAGMKRREPDTVWEPEPYPFKHHQPTWK